MEVSIGKIVEEASNQKCSYGCNYQIELNWRTVNLMKYQCYWESVNYGRAGSHFQLKCLSGIMLPYKDTYIFVNICYLKNTCQNIWKKIVFQFFFYKMTNVSHLFKRNLSCCCRFFSNIHSKIKQFVKKQFLKK